MNKIILTDEPEHDEDPRWAYDMPKEQAHDAWPCGQCGVRRDEHADQPEQSSMPALDITDHNFVEKFTPVTIVEGGSK